MSEKKYISIDIGTKNLAICVFVFNNDEVHMKDHYITSSVTIIQNLFQLAEKYPNFVWLIEKQLRTNTSAFGLMNFVEGFCVAKKFETHLIDPKNKNKMDFCDSISLDKMK